MAKLHFRYAAMNAGKSTKLLQVEHNYLQHGRTPLLYTYAEDDRFGLGKVTSRLGASSPAQCFNENTDMFREVRVYRMERNIEKVGAVLIDEAQFLTRTQVRALHRAVHEFDVPVMCFGLRSDFKGQPFEGSAMLLTLAEDIEEVKNICGCGRKATMNMRVDAYGDKVTDGPQLFIGDAEYVEVCAKCYYGIPR